MTVYISPFKSLWVILMQVFMVHVFVFEKKTTKQQKHKKKQKPAKKIKSERNISKCSWFSIHF
jgi:uncharacterized membrane protein